MSFVSSNMPRVCSIDHYHRPQCAVVAGQMEGTLVTREPFSPKWVTQSTITKGKRSKTEHAFAWISAVITIGPEDLYSVSQDAFI